MGIATALFRLVRYTTEVWTRQCRVPTAIEEQSGCTSSTWNLLYLWQTPLVGLHVVSDGLIAIAYFSIPAMLTYFVQKRGDIPFSKVFMLFGAFIILCGCGHLLDIWTLLHPDYWISGLVLALAALVSVYTALQMVELLPQFLALQTPEQLEAINRELKQQVAVRQQAEETLQMIVAGTSFVTGDDFFLALAQKLAIALFIGSPFE